MHVRLEKEWTDGTGKTHAAGDMVDVDAATLAKLQAGGIVGEEVNWAGPTGGGAGTNWAGPTSTQP